MKTLGELAARLARREITSEGLVEAALARIAHTDGEGSRAFMRVYRDAALESARASDRLRRHDIAASSLAGIPVAVKDLFDVAGDVTRAGSKVLAEAAPAGRDAVAVARLRAAGAVIIGRTTMTEFAYSGLGINPHYGTPASPWDRQRRRVPGGSSSGAAVSVADEMAVVGLGTDTGGSVRTPAAFCGVTGFKPTARRVPLSGAYPLSASLDSIGPIAPSVACCALVDAVLAGEDVELPAALPIAGLRLAVVRPVMCEGLDDEVARVFERALGRLSAAGARLREPRAEAIERMYAAGVQGAIAGPEAWALHRDALTGLERHYDPRVAARIRRGETYSAADYIGARATRAALMALFAAESAPFDAWVAPTVSRIAPEIAPLEADDELYVSTNMEVLRNTSLLNALDGCALTLPCHNPGRAAVGLMLCGPAGADRHILAVGLAVESVLRA